MDNNTLKTYCNIKGIKIPLYSEYEYYLEQLVRANLLAPNYKNELNSLHELLEKYNFNKAEFSRVVNGTAEVIKSKIVNDYIRPFFDSLVTGESKIAKIINKRYEEDFTECVDPLYISLDMRSANKSIVEFFFPNIYEDSLLEVVPQSELFDSIKNWKYVREIIFGKAYLIGWTNMLKIVMEYIFISIDGDYQTYNMKFAKLQGDELLFEGGFSCPSTYINSIKSLFDIISNQKIFMGVEFLGDNEPIKNCIVHFLTNLNRYIKISVYKDRKVFDRTFEEYVTIRTTYGEDSIKTDLFGCDGTKYYYYLKKYHR
jgi:hypothetical protein